MLGFAVMWSHSKHHASWQKIPMTITAWHVRAKPAKPAKPGKPCYLVDWSCTRTGWTRTAAQESLVGGGCWG